MPLDDFAWPGVYPLAGSSDSGQSALRGTGASKCHPDFARRIHNS
jgi:hypothetical protein